MQTVPHQPKADHEHVPESVAGFDGARRDPRAGFIRLDTAENALVQLRDSIR